jgi:hypothetical protein
MKEMSKENKHTNMILPYPLLKPVYMRTILRKHGHLEKGAWKIPWHVLYA